MIRGIEIRQMAEKYSIKPEVIEKDYILGWVIAALYEHEISAKWIFKGGTALKKCYFHDYRFSEDLDYSVVNAKDLTEEALSRVIDSITNNTYSKSGIAFLPKYQKVEIFKNIDNRTVAQVRLYYRGPISPSSPRSAPRIKLDLTSGECLTDTPVITKIHHPYSDEQSFNPQTLCYSFNEIFAEKLRALVERCRPRDIYDIVHCFESKSPNVPDLQIVAAMFRQKCEAKNIKGITEEVLLKQLEESKSSWDEQLAHQITDLKPFDDFAGKAMEVMRLMLHNWQ